MKKKEKFMEILEKINLNKVNLDDNFFDSLKKDYQDFERWFLKKKSENLEVYVKFDNNKKIKIFLMLQIKNEIEEDILPLQKQIKRIKISTFKIDEEYKSQRFSEALINIIFTIMDEENVDECYVSLFKEKQDNLYKILLSWGFIETGFKNKEIILTKFKNKSTNSIKSDYRWYFRKEVFKNYKNSNYYLIPFETEYHDKLFPENKLWKTSNKAKEFNISSISITKTYLSKTPYIKIPEKGDFLLEYRISDIPPKIFRSAITGVGIITEVINGKNMKLEEWLKIVGNTSVFTSDELKKEFACNRKIIIKFLHIFSFDEKNNINYQFLKDNNMWKEKDYLPSHPMENKIKIINLILEKWKSKWKF